MNKLDKLYFKLTHKHTWSKYWDEYIWQSAQGLIVRECLTCGLRECADDEDEFEIFYEYPIGYMGYDGTRITTYGFKPNDYMLIKNDQGDWVLRKREWRHNWC